MTGVDARTPPEIRRGATARRLGVKFIQVALLMLLVLFYALTVRVGMRYPSVTDFAKFYAAAQLLRAGEDIYAPVAIDALGPLPPEAKFTRAALHPNLNLPIVTALFVPFTWGSFSAGFLWWSILSLLCGFGAILLAATTTERRAIPRTRVIWLVILLLGYFPTWATVQLGQVSLFLFLLLVIAWAAARQGKNMTAGVAVGVAMLLKIFVLVLIPFFLVQRRWRLAGWSLGVFGAGILVSLALFGVDAHRAYVAVLGDITWYAANWNASLLGFFTRILGGSENTPAIDAPWMARGLAYGLALALLVVLLWLAWRTRADRTPRSFDLGFGACLALMLLATPLGWMYYFPMLFVAYFVAWPIARETSIRRRTALLAAYLLSTAPLPLVPSSQLSSPIAWFTWASVYVYSLILLITVLFVMMHRAQAMSSRSRQGRS